MNVFYVTMQFPAPSETFASNDVLSLHRQGMNVSVHSLRGAHQDTKRMIEDRGLEAVPVTHNSLWTSLKGILLGFRHPRKLAKLTAWNLKYNRRNRSHLLKSFLLFPRVIELFDIIRRTEPEVVHLFWGHYPAMVAYLVQEYLPNTKVSTFLGAYDLVMKYGGGEEVARHADIIWTHVKENVSAIVGIGVQPERVKVVYRGIDLSKIKTFPTKVAQRIITVGELSLHKGIDEVLSVFSHILAEWPDATLYILGDGPERERLESLAKNLGIEQAVTFLGHVSHNRVLEEMAAAEIFLHMSKADWLPNALKEAMASGCVCIATATTGISELIPDGKTGFVVPIGEVQKATAVITDIFSGEVDISSMTHNAKQHVQRYFNLETSMGEYKTSWEALLK